MRSRVMRVGKVPGDLRVEAGSTLEPEGPEGVVVDGEARFEGDAEVRGNLSCRALDLRSGALVVEGDLLASEAVESRRGTLQVRRNLRARSIEVSRACIVGGNLDALSVEIGGHLEVDGATKTRSLEAGGSIELKGPLDADSVEVGGKIRLGSATVRGSIEVGGHLLVEGPLTFGKLEAGGRIELRGSSRGESIEVGGALEVGGDLELARSLEVGGMAKVQGRLRTPRLEVGGMFRGGSLTCGDIEVGGALEIDEGIEAQRMEVGGSLRARRGTASDRVEVGGRITTQEGLKAPRIDVNEDSRVVGALVAGTLVLEDDAEAEDVWGQEVRLERKTRVRNVYAGNIEVARRARVDGRLLYTGTLRADPEARFAMPPEKVAQLPPPPL